MTCILAAVMSAMGLLQTSAPAAPNLLVNPELEVVSDGLRPDGWEPLAIGVPARFTVDREVVHGGEASLRIDAAERTRSYARSAPIAVVPGEVLAISGWTRVRDVPSDKGTVILIAEFCRGIERGEVAKVGVATASGEWQRLEGRVTVPAGADTLRLRMGFSYALGTCWWDDLTVQAETGLVARVNLADGWWFPAEGAISTTILNRSRARRAVSVGVELDKTGFSLPVELTGEPEQTVRVPVAAPARGKHRLSVRLEAGADRPAFWSSAPVDVVVPAPLSLAPPIPTHWAVEDGEPRVLLEIQLALGNSADARDPLVVELRDEAGRVVHRQEADLKATGPSGMARLELHPPAPAEGAYTFRVIVASSDSASITVEQPWWVISRRLARVQVGTDGYLIRGGQRIFPLGMFNNEARLAEEVEAGFNIVHFYNAARVRPGRRPDDQRLAEAMNKCARAGMHVLLLVPMEYAFAGEWEAFTRRIRMFRNHPALLAWDEEEGLARGDMTMEVLRRIREVLRREDPHHPFMVGDAHTVIDRVNDRSRMFPLDQMDLGMWWWYPFPLKRGGPTASRPDDALQGEQAGSGMLLEPPAFLNAPTDKPIWVGIQAYKKPGPNRYPTPAEYRAQAYLSVIAGAKGLMWYGGSVTGGAFLKPDEAHWPQLKQLVRELRDLEPLLLGASEPVRAIGPAGVGVSATVKQAGARRILIAVNRGPDVCNATFELPGLPAGTVEVVGESRRVAATVGEITDRFEPFAAHVYDLGRSLP